MLLLQLQDPFAPMHSNLPQTLEDPPIGETMAGGFFGGVIRICNIEHVVIWAPKAVGEFGARLGPINLPVIGALSACNSAGNTKALARAGSSFANDVLRLNLCSHTDWCIPSRDVLELGFRFLKPANDPCVTNDRSGSNSNSNPIGNFYHANPPKLTSAPLFCQGNKEAFERLSYASSTMVTPRLSMGQCFLTGLQSPLDADYPTRIRLVRVLPKTKLNHEPRRTVYNE